MTTCRGAAAAGTDGAADGRDPESSASPLGAGAGRSRLRRQLPSLLVVTLLVAGLVAVGSVSRAGSAHAASTAPGAGGAEPTGTVETEFGPLTPADRDFLVKVRQAGLWEGPSGQQAQIRSKSQAIKDAGIHMVAGHAELDAKVLAIGEQLGVPLPDEPNADQKKWMAEMAAAKNADDYDEIFVKRLRAAHGKVYGLVAQIRAGTRNSVIRKFAQRAMTIVLDHIVMLERTGMVDYDSLPFPPAPNPGDDPSAGVVQTDFGPMTAGGRDFLIKVRLAGLWEGPSGRQAQQRAGSDAVKEAGQHMIEGHAELDRKVLALGKQLGVDLPDEPNADQKKWMAEMTAAETPEDYDQIFVDRLRAAHGKVYGLVAQIRANSRNEKIRAFAQRAMTIVLDHIVMLERTGLVKYSELPPPPAPATAPAVAKKGSADVATAGSAPAKGFGAGSASIYIIVIMLGVAGMISLVALRELYAPNRG
jgi:predicted outer membrane protein